MSVTANGKAYINDKASSASPAAEVLTYYEKDAYENSTDRKIIAEKGFQEWLLAYTNQTATTARMRRESIYALYTQHRETDIVILIANIMGGVTDGSNRKN